LYVNTAEYALGTTVTCTISITHLRVNALHFEDNRISSLLAFPRSLPLQGRARSPGEGELLLPLDHDYVTTCSAAMFWQAHVKVKMSWEIALAVPQLLSTKNSSPADFSFPHPPPTHIKIATPPPWLPSRVPSSGLTGKCYLALHAVAIVSLHRR
jgi:hypothetical protein